jgi:hypothetical protein
VTDAAIAVIEPRGLEGLGLQFKAAATGRLYRLVPTRVPGQPRFWRFLVFRCLPGGMADPAEHAWAVAGGMTREEIPAALEAIRADVESWLERPECQELRRWLLSPDAGAAPPPPGRTRAGGEGTPPGIMPAAGPDGGA